MAKKTVKKTTRKTSVKEYETCIEESLNGTPILNLEPDVERYGFKIGAKKLSIIMERLEDVKLFLKRHPYTPRVKVELTAEQKELWSRAKKVLKTGLVEPVRVKTALVKGGIAEGTADSLIDQEVMSNRAKAEGLLNL